MKIQCKVCNKTIDKYNKNQMFLKFHVLKEHNLTHQQYYDKYFKKGKEGICKVCGNPTKYIKFSQGYRDYCSVKCSNLDPKTTKKKLNTYLEKTGYRCTMENPNSLEKLKKTNRKKYGSDYYFSSNDAKKKLKNLIENRTIEEKEKILTKRKETNIKKYGVECVFSTEEVKEKINNTCIKKYGVSHPMQNNEIKDKIVDYHSRLSYLDKQKRIKWLKDSRNKKDIKFLRDMLPIDYELIEYNIENYPEYRKIICPHGHEFEIKQGTIKKRFENNHDICTVCNPLYSYNFSQNSVYEYIKSLIPDEIFRYNTRKIITPLELDVYIPSFKIAIEFNGLYWHSDKNNIDKNYHKNKTEMCENKRIHLIHIYEDDWNFKRDIVKSRLRNLFKKTDNKIYARKCEIKSVDFYDTKKFLIENHIQGNVNSKYSFGLYYNSELVSIMTFGKLRKNLGRKSINGSFELLRFCNKLNFNVIGGASRLFKYFIVNYNPNKIISYADRSWTMNNGKTIYDILGFKYNGITEPNYYYIENGGSIRENRFKYRKSELVKMGYNIEKSESQIMIENGYSKIYNSGSLRYEYNKKLN